jgi:hypothetical protein
MSPNPTLVTGVVVDAGGNPIKDARAYFLQGPVPVPDIAALTDRDGRFTLSAPVPGTYELQVAAEDFSPTTKVLNLTGESRLDIAVRLFPPDT